MAKRESKLVSKIDINMTPMIDVVFQLLTFFMLTLKTVVVEGDFNIRMPLGASAGETDLDPTPPLIIRMTANSEGFLTGVQLGGRSIVGQETLDQLATAAATFNEAVKRLEIAKKSKNDAQIKQANQQIARAREPKNQAFASLTSLIQEEIKGAVPPPVEKEGKLQYDDALELELDCDPGLTYDHVVSAINAASGVLQGDEVIPLIQKIKFAPPRKSN